LLSIGHWVDYIKAGVSNSVSCAGHILTKKGSRAAFREKLSPRRNRRLRVPLYYKKTVVSAII